MGITKRALLVSILIGSFCSPIVTYFGVKSANNNKNTKNNASSHASVAPSSNSIPTIPITPSRNTTPWIPTKKGGVTPPNNNGGDGVETNVVITPSRHHGSYFHYSFSGQLKTFSKQKNGSMKEVQNNYHFKETEYGYLTIIGQNLDKIKITSYVPGQVKSTAGMQYIRTTMIDFKTQIIDKKVDLQSVKFSIQAHGLATCPSVDFYVDYNGVGDNTANVSTKLGSYGIYSMNSDCAHFFSSWLFLLILLAILLVIITIIAIAMPSTWLFSLFFVGALGEVISTTLFGIGGWILSDVWNMFGLFGWLHTLGSERHKWEQQAAHPHSSIPRFLGMMGGSFLEHKTTPFGGDILEYAAKKQSQSSQLQQSRRQQQVANAQYMTNNKYFFGTNAFFDNTLFPNNGKIFG